MDRVVDFRQVVNRFAVCADIEPSINVVFVVTLRIGRRLSDVCIRPPIVVELPGDPVWSKKIGEKI